MAEFEPQWRGVFENWTHAYMKVHHWKIRDMDLADAVQEGARIFAWCLRKTTSRGGKIDNERWFMRYYQRAVETWLKTESLKNTRRRDTLATLIQEQQTVSTEPDAPLLVALSQDASRELRTVLRVILTTPHEFLQRLLLTPSQADDEDWSPGRDNDWSRRLCRLCRIPVNENIIGELRQLLEK